MGKGAVVVMQNGADAEPAAGHVLLETAHVGGQCLASRDQAVGIAVRDVVGEAGRELAIARRRVQ
jgi:hypothetical protein